MAQVRLKTKKILILSFTTVLSLCVQMALLDWDLFWSCMHFHICKHIKSKSVQWFKCFEKKKL